MNSNIKIEKQQDKFVYEITGNWEEIEVAKLISVCERIDSPYVVQYRNFKYIAPVYERGIFRHRQIKTPGKLIFESDPIHCTLEDFMKKKASPMQSEEILSVVSQIWVGLNSIRNISKSVQGISIHPAFISITTIPGTKQQEYQVQLMCYIPMFFYGCYLEDAKMYIIPQVLQSLETKLTPHEWYYDRCDLYSLGCLISYLWSGRLPFKSGTTIETLMSQKDYIDVPEIQIESVRELLNQIFIAEANWDYTYNDKCLTLARLVTFMETKSGPEDFEVIQEIGHGAFGRVYQAIQNSRRGSRVVALKELVIVEDQSDLIDNEINIMKLCEHPHIVKMYDAFKLKRSFINEDVHESVSNIVLEYCDGGTMSSFFENEYKGQPLPNNLISHVLSGMVKGLIYLHFEHEIVHRDLKPENILLKVDPSNPHVPIIKIADFGLSKIVSDDVFMKTMVGTPLFMAPEILYRQLYTYKCDLWSLGIMLYYFKTHQYPLTCDPQKFFKKIQNQITPDYDAKIWKDTPGLLKLVEGLIVYSQIKRFSWNDIVNNEYVKTALDSDQPIRDYGNLH